MGISAAQSERISRNHSSHGICKKFNMSLEPNIFEGHKIRYVKKARMWCKTWFENKKQKQQWAMNVADFTNI